MSTEHPIVVVGLGAMGAAACAHLARRGVPVVGLEQYTPAHDLGSSHGGSRLARRAYFEHPAYVPLLERAFRQWQQLGAETGVSCLHRVGVLLVGKADSAVLNGSRRSAECHDIPVRSLDPDELRATYPQFRFSSDMHALLEPGAGFVVPEHGVRAHLDLARRHGADLRYGTRVTGIDADRRIAHVCTDRGNIRARRVVVTAGAWTGKLLPTLAAAVRLEPQRKHIVWFSPSDPQPFASSRLPAWAIDDGGACGPGFYYGVPTWPGQIGPAGVKVGFHGHGTPVDVERFERTPDPRVIERFRRDVRRFLPGVGESVSGAATCLYTMSPDEHFVIDRLPGAETIVFAAGFSGHGYKFAPVIGELLADLALRGETDLPAGFLSLDRFCQ
jgi:sarcosine oxidase